MTDDNKGTIKPVTIALGTSCLTAFALRRVGLETAPMPFDWLATSPDMIRHCLLTDFSVLLDRTQYRSRTGQRGPADPVEACAHEYYHRQYGIQDVFNHSDPTQDASYRYLKACIDRFRETMSSKRPKLFVQIRGAYGSAQQDFEENADLLEQSTWAGNLLQVVVNPANKHLTLPIFNVVETRGVHTLYRMKPTSKMEGVEFFGAVDNEAIGSLIAGYAESGRRIFAAEDLVSAPASVALNAALENAHVMAHIADRGDTKPDRTGWTGNPGSGLAVQGVCIYAASGQGSISYQVAEMPDRFSERMRADGYAGTRGLNRPIYGLRMSVTDDFSARFRVSVEVSFVDGTMQGPEIDQRTYEFVSQAPLEAIRLLVTERN